MPHALAESAYPGTIDEKIGCEVATYAWIEDNCPTIPIPHLWGFTFSDGRTVSRQLLPTLTTLVHIVIAHSTHM
jgi:hypothetical protein